MWTSTGKKEGEGHSEAYGVLHHKFSPEIGLILSISEIKSTSSFLHTDIGR